MSAATVVATGLETPWSITFHNETPLISERYSGRVLALDPGGGQREIATVADVAPQGEGGLLGIAAREDFLYAYFTASDENRVERYPLEGDGVNLTLGAPEIVLDGIPAASYHNGGRIAFGPDGLLYVTTGDAGDTSRAQDLDSLGGKVLRLTPEGEVPDDNPFPRSYVYSYGHHNPQGLAWRSDGTLYASEFGQDTWDELNVIKPGANYGWPEVAGTSDQDDYTDPIQQWEPADASPSGLAIIGDDAYIANLRGERLRQVPLSDTETSIEHMMCRTLAG